METDDEHKDDAAYDVLREVHVPDVLVTPDAAALPPPVAEQVTVEMDIGSITYYTHDRRFQATCPCGDHEVRGMACRLTRYEKGNTVNLAKGRPIGLHTAWLELQQELQFASGSEHTHPFVVAILGKTLRIEGPDSFSTYPHANVLLCRERPRRVGEGVEPDGLP